VTSTPLPPWTVIVPVKSTARAKSRILLDPPVRRALARAMALDTVSAVLAAGPAGRTVVVVEDQPDGAPFAELAGPQVFVTRTAELNAAIRDGLAFLGPAAQGPVAVVPADLPSLTPGELADALDQAARHPRSVVPDRAGTGTTLLAARSGALLRPRYGPDSFARHRRDGAVPLDVPETSGLRRDVDQVDDLRRVTGARTLAVLDTLDRCGPQPADVSG
jgi:2-phospho-L-lactate guanylyltransferase